VHFAYISIYDRSGEPETILVNGNSFAARNATGSSTPLPWTNQTVANLTCEPDIIKVKPDSTYRFRTIGALALSLVSLQLELHENLTVIAADGQYTQPTNTDHIQVGPGQRFDFLLKTKSAAEIKALGKQHFWFQLDTLGRPLDILSYAVLEYEIPATKLQAAPTARPATPPFNSTDPNWTTWLEYQLQPLTPNGFPAASEVDRTVYLSFIQLVNKTGIFWPTNNETWTESNEHLGHTSYTTNDVNVGVPYLVNIYKNGSNSVPNFETTAANHGYDPNLNVYAAEVGVVIDIVLLNNYNLATGNFDIHPWHIHGRHIWDLGSGSGTYDAVANEKRFANFTPALRDTTYTYKYYNKVNGTSVPLHAWRAWRLNVTDAG
jgi:L-ascorbate oxidase